MTPAESLAAELGAKVGEVDGRALTPMLCREDDTAERILGRRGWIYELKLDGVRVVSDKRGASVALAYRSRRDATASYPEIAGALRALAEERVVLDGEIVAFDDAGKPSFQRLGSRIHARRGAPSVPVAYVVFDVLAVGDRDVRALPLEARKELLARVVPAGQRGFVRLHPTFDDGRALFAFCLERGLEGVVAKRAGSRYRAGQRSQDWVKVKHERDADLVVVGWTEGEGRRSRLGALDVASYEDGALVVRGAVGSGLDEDTIDALLERLAAIEQGAPAARGRYSAAKRRHHVRPEIVASVRYMSFSDAGALRFPVFRGLRADVRPEDCTVTPEDDVRRHVTAPGAIALPDGTTKLDLCRHYERVAEALLPYVKGRASILVRPDGPLWPLPRWTPSWVEAVTAGAEGEVRGVLVDDLDTLLFAIEAGCVSLLMTPHVEGAPDTASFVALRAGPGGARAVRALADELGLASFVKGGGEGTFDVLLALGAAPGAVAHALGDLVARLAGEGVAVAPSVAAPWALAFPCEGRARVSVPLSWDALDDEAAALPALSAFGGSVAGREGPADDPMRAMLDARADVVAAARALEGVVAARAPRAENPGEVVGPRRAR